MKQTYELEIGRLRESFETTSDGRANARGRSGAVDKLVTSLWQKHLSDIPGEPAGIAVAAIGGYGRGTLFPFSDIDLLFLCDKQLPEQPLKDRIRTLNQELWDLRLKVSPFTKMLADCAKLQSDNVEATISLLDCRYLAGDRE